MIHAKVETSEVLIEFVESIFKDQDVTIADWDLDRIYLENEEDEWTIRMWNATEDYIEWTLYQYVDEAFVEKDDGRYIV